MNKFGKKLLSFGLVISVLSLSWMPGTQAFWGENVWSSLTANVFSVSEDLPSGLFFDWEESFPENSLVLAFQNSPGLKSTTEKVSDNLNILLERIEETPESAMFSIFLGNYLGGFESAETFLSKVQSTEIFISSDQFQKTIYDDMLSPGAWLESSEKFEGCMAISIKADEAIIDLLAKFLQGQSSEAVNFSINKQEASLAATMGCDQAPQSVLNDLPSNVNFVAFQSGFDYEDLSPTEKKEGLIGLFAEFYESIRQINAHKVTEDLAASALLFSLEDGSHKIETVLSLRTKNSANLLKKYWEGKILRTPYHMNQAAEYKANLLTFSGTEKEYVFLEENFNNIDWTHWYGKSQELLVTAAPVVILLAGLGAAVSLQTYGGYFEKARETEVRTGVNNAGTILKTQLVTVPDATPPTSIEEVNNILDEIGNYKISTSDDTCIYYIRSISKPGEFAVFANTDPMTVNGTPRMSSAISKIFAERELTCTTPEIKGSLIFKF